MWSLDHPQLLAAVLLLPLLIFAVDLRRGRGGKISFSFGIWGDGRFTFRPTARRVLRLFGRVFFWAGFCSLVVALAGPVLIEKQRKYLGKGVDLIIALDVSPSMSARDVGEVNRFEAARQVIRSFIAGRQNDAIGLVLFGAEASLRVPPTLDYRFVEQGLDSARVMGLGDGTAIGTGVAVAALHLRGSSSKERMIILITDGDNNAGRISPQRAAEAAAGLGIRIYAIGIGTEGETTIEITDPETGKQLRGVYRSTLNEELLKSIAARTGGRYFHSGTLGMLSTVFQEIDKLESRQQEVAVFIERRQRHRLFILLGFALVLAGVLVDKLLVGEL